MSIAAFSVFWYYQSFVVFSPFSIKTFYGSLVVHRVWVWQCIGHSIKFGFCFPIKLSLCLQREEKNGKSEYFSFTPNKVLSKKTNILCQWVFLCMCVSENLCKKILIYYTSLYFVYFIRVPHWFHVLSSSIYGMQSSECTEYCHQTPIHTQHTTLYVDLHFICYSIFFLARSFAVPFRALKRKLLAVPYGCKYVLLFIYFVCVAVWTIADSFVMNSWWRFIFFHLLQMK